MTDYTDLARELHQYYPAADAHFDLPAVICRLNRAGETHITEQYFLKDFQSAGLNLLGASIYLSSSELYPDAWQAAMDQYHALEDDIRPLYPDVRLISGPAEFEETLTRRQLGIFVYLEGLEPVESDPSLLKEASRLGILGASLTWSRPNAFATGCCPAGSYEERRGFLTGAGREILKNLEQLGMFLDISHLNDDGTADVERLAAFPYIATHSNSRSVCHSYRNLTDSQLQRLCGRGGFVGVNACRALTATEPARDPVESVCRHILYMRRLCGSSHIGYGLDLCDMLNAASTGSHTPRVNDDCIKNHGEMPLLTAKLLEWNVSVEEAAGIMGGNLVEYLRRLFSRTPAADGTQGKETKA